MVLSVLVCLKDVAASSTSTSNSKSSTTSSRPTFRQHAKNTQCDNLHQNGNNNVSWKNLPRGGSSRVSNKNINKISNVQPKIQHPTALLTNNPSTIRQRLFLLRNGYLINKIKQNQQQLQQQKNDPTSSSSGTSNRNTNHNNEYNPLRMYLSCICIVFVWMATGTLFYSWLNEWPIPQSFFYAVDAGMSIGFCTDVYEVKLISKAFTIIYILLGASVVGGALALFIQDAVEGVTSPAIQEYEILLEKEVFDAADVSRTGVLSYEEFRSLILSSSTTTSNRAFTSNGASRSGIIQQQNQDQQQQQQQQHDHQLTEDDIQILWKKFDKLKDGVIHFEEFVGTYRGIGQLIDSLKTQQQEQRQLHGKHRSTGKNNNSNNHQPSYIFVPLVGLCRRYIMQLRLFLSKCWKLEHRIYFVFCLWIGMGITWGIVRQKWDPITATHFAISALATGGLTGPAVNSYGILEAEPAIFCGIFCLFGIPLFALTLGHFARVLVSNHINAMERVALTKPLTQTEYNLAKHLTTPNDNEVHLSDFIVLQLLRQGRISEDTIHTLKDNFDLLDDNNTGTLSLEQATSTSSTTPSS